MVTDYQLQQLADNKQRYLGYKPLGEVIEPIQTQLTKSHGRALGTAQRIWSDAVGADLAALAFPSALRDGILIISVAEPAVKFTIEQIYRTALLQQLRAELGRAVIDIKCVLLPPTGGQ